MNTILVIDDENMNLISTRHILESCGYNVVTADSGEKGIAILEEISIDLLLLDVKMPGMDGIETLKEIRRKSRFSKLKVIFFTSSDSEDALVQAAHLYASGFLKKPCMPEDIKEIVGSVLEGSYEKTILAVDDEPINHIFIRKIFEGEYRVDSVSSGAEALEYLNNNLPDIILMDLKMPEVSGTDTYLAIREVEAWSKIPVVFITADEDGDTEVRLLKMGARDFITKPFVPEVARERIKRIIELSTLQDFLQSEVDRKTNDLEKAYRRLKDLSEQIVMALSGTIDEKDQYTNGHSKRVAIYSREIAIRMKKSEEEINNIFFAAMLHDVGKIGIPLEIINKPGRLTDEEFEIIKSHTEKGAKILSTISALPSLSVGAHWHHERYDGTGYPDGLKGTDIPEIARIICVADCYDAMSSNRSYRQALAQQVVRSEIEKGRGSQFDPAIADIMLDMISEDKDYKMREEK
ncbi:MAG: response regulator [Lachnospiraceae bacterium]|nr:response regulator [Lachnospiraceae bacterium]